MWLPIVFFWGGVEIRNISIGQTGSGINPHHCSYGKISLMSNTLKIVRDTMLESKDVRQESTNGLSIGTMTLNRPCSRSLKLQVKYFENGDRYDDGVKGSGRGIVLRSDELGPLIIGEEVTTV